MKLSIIIPTYNRDSVLEQTLSDITKLTSTRAGSEILVIDNKSTDSTKKVVKKFPNIRYFFEERQGKNYALNTAIDLARGDILVFADDDISPSKQWLDEIISSCKNWPEHDIFGGKILPRFPSETPDWIRDGYFADFVYAIHDLPQEEDIYQSDATPGGPNCWVTKRLFDKGFRYDVNIGPSGTGRVSGSELEFFTRMIEHGYKPVYIPNAVVEHRIQPFQTKVRYLLKRSFSSGTGYAYIYGFGRAKLFYGAPRYLYKQIAVYFFHSLVNFLTFNRKASFEKLMQISHRLGCITGARRLKGLDK